MGKFETYPEATTLENSDITLYNKSSITHKVTFGRLVNLIKSKIAESGFVTSINTGAGLTGGAITTSGTIKCKLKTEALSSLASSAVSTMADRQYPVNLDKDGNLSVNVPWSGSTYLGEKGVTIAGNKISASLKNNVPSALSSANMGSTANRQYAVGLDVDGKLSVNIPWTDTVSAGMTTNGSNADSHVNFAGAFTVGSRKSGSTVGTNSTAEGNGVTASGENSHAEGFSATASAHEAHVEGCFTIASGICSHAEGWGTEASEEGSHAEGNGFNLDGYSHGSVAGLNTSASNAISANNYGSHAEGFAEGDRQFSIAGIIQANGIGSHAEGCADADGSSHDSMIIASGKGSHAEGWANNSNANCYILASGNGSHAEGVGTKASSTASHAEGCKTEANGEASHAEGQYTEANGSYSSVKGCGNNGLYYYTDVSELDTTVNHSISANGMGSSAEGYTEYDENQQLELRSQSIIQANGRGSHAEGCAVVDLQSETDSMIIAYGDGSHAEGYSDGESIILASGIGSHAEGCNTTASGDYSHAEGKNTIASSANSHAEGSSTTASGANAHAEGAYTESNGNTSHTEGSHTKASGNNSHAEGSNTKANGNNSHAEGSGTTASKSASHAEGSGTIASGAYSHAEGEETDATKLGSHAEGGYTTASGDYSHAEGGHTTASGDYSHASGYYATANEPAQFVHGGYNKKFGETQNVFRGAFGFNPSGTYYNENTSLELKNGGGGTVLGGKTMTISLEACSIYMLYVTVYNGCEPNVFSIATPRLQTSSSTTPTVVNITPNSSILTVDELTNNKIKLSSTYDYMFHLIRIM